MVDAPIPLAKAKARLLIEFDDQDADIQDILNEAYQLVLDYLKTPTVVYTENTLPSVIRTATLLVFNSMWINRDGEVDPITPAVQSVLRRKRDPALA